jgi:sugar phosphate isomerase/epimerase
MKTMKGPGIYLAQFAADDAPYNSLPDLSKWVAARGFSGVQIPTWDNRLIDMKKAAESKTYCDDLKGVLAESGLEVTELGSHITGQLVAVHPAHDQIMDSFAPAHVHNNPAARRAWAEEQMRFAARASRNLGIDRHVSFTGSLLWPYLYPYPQWPEGLVEEAFDELAKRWTPILNDFDEQGVDLCFEIHPCEDVHDGLTFEMFLERVGNHPRCNILYDPSHFVLQALD